MLQGENILMILMFKKFQIAFGFQQQDRVTAWEEEIFTLWNPMEPQVLQEPPPHGFQPQLIFDEQRLRLVQQTQIPITLLRV